MLTLLFVFFLYTTPRAFQCVNMWLQYMKYKSIQCSLYKLTKPRTGWRSDEDHIGIDKSEAPLHPLSHKCYRRLRHFPTNSHYRWLCHGRPYVLGLNSVPLSTPIVISLILTSFIIVAILTWMKFRSAGCNRFYTCLSCSFRTPVLLHNIISCLPYWPWYFPYFGVHSVTHRHHYVIQLSLIIIKKEISTEKDWNSNLMIFEETWWNLVHDDGGK